MNASKKRLPAAVMASDTKLASRSGAARMREAANAIIERDCMEIAEALSKSSKNGRLQSAKLLYELSERQEQSGEGEYPPKTRSMAAELTNAPQWTGDWPEVEDDEDDEEATDLQGLPPFAN